MIGFFPKPYPDEILYSVLARYHIRSGNRSPKETQKELFNSQNTVATADLPCNLNSLIENLKSFSNHTTEYLIYEHTLYSFYNVFLPLKRATIVIDSMKAVYGGNIHTRTGIMASLVTMLRFFRFCPQCLEEDLQKHGEAYWHRLHQTPGVLVCPVHAMRLDSSTVPIQGFNRHEYYAASIENCSVTLNQQIYSNETLEKLLLLAKDICWLMNSSLSSREPEWFRRRYMALLIDKGFATPTGRVNQRRLLDNFLFFYGHEMLAALDSMVNFKEEHNWVSSIVRKHRKSFHPVRHLLMIRFLTNSISEFFNTNHEYKPFGEEPWLCLNAAADHYLKPVVTNLVITQCSDTKEPVGTFSCSCGMVYCRTGPDTTDEDKQRIGKVKAFGQLWEQKLKQLVEIERLGLRETARRLRVDSRTVVRYVTQLQLKTSWQSRQENHPINLQAVTDSNLRATVVDLKIQHRNRWKALQKLYPEASKTTLRQLAKASYAWLYRHDRKWLNQNSPTLKVPTPSYNRVDWLERDKQVLAQVQAAVQLLLIADKPIRITVSRIAKSIDLLALFEQHLNRMPLTKAYLESVTETVEDFQIRRIQWAIKHLDERQEEVKAWKVIRVAGLKENFSDRVRAALESTLYALPN